MYKGNVSFLSSCLQHVVQHHVHTNDVVLDPDIEGVRAVRLNPRAPLRRWHAAQHLHFFVLIVGYAFTVVTNAASNMLEGWNYTPVSPLLARQRVAEVAASAVFVLRWVVLPVYQVRRILIKCILCTKTTNNFPPPDWQPADPPASCPCPHGSRVVPLLLLHAQPQL